MVQIYVELYNVQSVKIGVYVILKTYFNKEKITPKINLLYYTNQMST